MTYTVVLTLHSWVRWLVVVGGIAALFGLVGRARGDADHDHLLPEAAHRGFIHLVNIQFTLGLALYLFLSPWVRAAWSDWAVAMGDPVLRFFGVEHVVGMTVAVSAAHMSLVWRTKLPRGRRWVIGAQVTWLVVTLLSIPWPFLAYGRALFRL